jgi:hypothetical protein
MAKQKAKEPGAEKASEETAAKTAGEKAPLRIGRCRTAENAFIWRELYDRSIGAAPPGAVGVALGALNVRAPRLPNEEPPPTRALASPASPRASAPAKVNITNFWPWDPP